MGSTSRFTSDLFLYLGESEDDNSGRYAAWVTLLVAIFGSRKTRAVDLAGRPLIKLSVVYFDMPHTPC